MRSVKRLEIRDFLIKKYDNRYKMKLLLKGFFDYKNFFGIHSIEKNGQK